MIGRKRVGENLYFSSFPPAAFFPALGRENTHGGGVSTVGVGALCALQECVESPNYTAAAIQHSMGKRQRGKTEDLFVFSTEIFPTQAGWLGMNENEWRRKRPSRVFAVRR